MNEKITWRQYVTRLTSLPSGEGKCIFVALHAFGSGKCFAQDPKHSPSVNPEEIRCLRRGFDSPGTLYTTGISLKGIRFVYMTSIDNTLIGKKTNLSLGCVVMRCIASDSVLIGIHSLREPVANVAREMAEVIDRCENIIPFS